MGRSGSQVEAEERIEAALDDVSVGTNATSVIGGVPAGAADDMDLGSDGEALEENNEESIEPDGGEQRQNMVADDEEVPSEEEAQGEDNRAEGDRSKEDESRVVQGSEDEAQEHPSQEDREEDGLGEDVQEEQARKLEPGTDESEDKGLGNGKGEEDQGLVLDETVVSELADALSTWSTMLPSRRSKYSDGRLKPGMCWSVDVDAQETCRTVLRNRGDDVVQTFPSSYQTVLQHLCKEITFHACYALAIKTFLGEWEFPTILKGTERGNLENPWGQFGGAVNLATFLINVRQGAIRWQAQYENDPGANDALRGFNPYLHIWGVAVYYHLRDYTITGHEMWRPYLLTTRVEGEFLLSPDLLPFRMLTRRPRRY